MEPPRNFSDGDPAELDPRAEQVAGDSATKQTKIMKLVQKQSDPAFGSDNRAIAIVSDVDIAHRIWLAGAIALTCDRNRTPCDILTTYSAGEAMLTGEIHPERHEVRPTSRIQEVSDEGLGGVLVIEADLKTFLQMKDEVEACYSLMVVIPVTSHPVSKNSAARIANLLAWHQPLLHLIER